MDKISVKLISDDLAERASILQELKGVSSISILQHVLLPTLLLVQPVCQPGFAHLKLKWVSIAKISSKV